MSGARIASALFLALLALGGPADSIPAADAPPPAAPAEKIERRRAGQSGPGLTPADTVVLGVKQAYYSYLQARALVRVAEETVRDRDLIVKQAEGFFEVGTRAKIDVVRAQSNLYNAQSGLISAQNGVRVSWVTLRNAMGLPDLPDQTIPDLPPGQVESFAVSTFPLTLDQSLDQAFKIRPELESFDAQLKAQDQVIATNRRGHLPDIIFDANYAR